MRKIFTENGWDDYIYWQETDIKVLKRINQLLRDIERDQFTGKGKPKPLKGSHSGWWSRRVDSEHRLVYRVSGDIIEIYQCKGHYDD